MVSQSALEEAWSRGASKRERGSVELICLRRLDGSHERPARAEISLEQGLVGDRWSLAPNPNFEAQVTLMELRVAALIAADRVPLDGPGDNLLVDLDLSVEALPVGARLRAGAAILEVTAKPHRGCKKFRERFGEEVYAWISEGSNEEGRWPGRRLRGVNCRVIEAGPVVLLDPIEVLR